MIRRALRQLLSLAMPLLLAVSWHTGPGAPRALADGWDDMRAEFRKGMKAEDWRERKDAFIYLSGYDQPEVVQEILSALVKETNAAVVLAGVEALGTQKSLGSREALFTVARKSGKGRLQLLVLVALSKQEGKEVDDLLVEVASGRGGPAAAQAALGLKGRKHAGAVDVLVRLLKHKDWQVRRAAAMSLRSTGAKDAVLPLATALGGTRGRDRNDLIAALEEITEQKFGNDPSAWKKYAKGTPADEIQAKPQLAPSAFGVPIYGQRVVICLDNSLRATDPHPYDSERLRELSDPPDGNPIPWYRVKTNGQFAAGQLKHLITGLPKGTKFEVITFNGVVRDVLGGLTNIGAGSRNAVFQALDGLQTDDGIASYDAMEKALDVVSPREGVAWKSGPDEILFITVNGPNRGTIKEPEIVAAAIGLKARLRMVPIHTVGIHYHPYEMCRQIAALTGGVYADLTK